MTITGGRGRPPRSASLPEETRRHPCPPGRACRDGQAGATSAARAWRLLRRRPLRDAAGRLWAGARAERSSSAAASRCRRPGARATTSTTCLADMAATLDLEHPSYQSTGQRPRAGNALLKELAAGKVRRALRPRRQPGLRPARRRWPRVRASSAAWSASPSAPDETASLAHVVCPDRTSWKAGATPSPSPGMSAWSNPRSAPWADTRGAVETLAAWSGRPGAAYDLAARVLADEIYPRGATVQPGVRRLLGGRAARTASRRWRRNGASGGGLLPGLIGRCQRAATVVAGRRRSPSCSTRSRPCSTAATPTTPGCRSCPIPSPK